MKDSGSSPVVDIFLGHHYTCPNINGATCPGWDTTILVPEFSFCCSHWKSPRQLIYSDPPSRADESHIRSLAASPAIEGATESVSVRPPSEGGIEFVELIAALAGHESFDVGRFDIL